MRTRAPSTVRPFVPADLGPLHELYTSLADLLPHHPRVGRQQFAADLVRDASDEAFDPAADIRLVAEREGHPVAFAHASFLAEDARRSDMRAGAAVLRTLLADEQDADACRALVRAVVGQARARSCPDLRALMAQYGPRFHNYGEAGLSAAWPWIGHALAHEGFTAFWPTLALWRAIDGPVEAPPLPTGAVLRPEWVSRVGTEGEWEGGYTLYIDGKRTADVLWHYGGKYVEGLAVDTAYLFWLGTDAPYRGRGIGRVLLRAALAALAVAGAREVCLRCRPDNFAAHAAYRAVGFGVSDLLWEFRWQGGP